ncbi:MAG TPA: zinc ribbon domain-containing protein [Accumulibacter sp.]|jgi:hypothetical protein|nr:zinc ribbon domain-containing protein [Accumulibacter sp.]HQC79239.1 zinc ribbon domain-containing protein [Accumulibacter sp.]
MYKQLRAPERLFRIGQWAVALLFSYFLVQVGASIIADLPLISRMPVPEDFLDKAGVEKIEAAINPTIKKIDSIDEELLVLAGQSSTANADYQKYKASFENWKQTRSTTERSAQNPEVVARARKLDKQLKLQQEIESALQKKEQQKSAAESSIKSQREAIAKLREDAEIKYRQAIHWYSMKAFFIRLAFVAPILVSAVWLFRRHRQGQYWPFVWGYVIFALFAFFFELVPYLPSFGGYIRYGVGAVLTFIGGRALIRSLQHYLEKKRLEQAAPQEKRKLDIRYEKALEAIAHGQCPSCERMVTKIEGTLVNFCMHCGLKIFGICGNCGLRHNAFFPFCPACGQPSVATGGAEPAAAERPAQTT